MLAARYASPSMVRLFSERTRARIWRDLWIILADEERKLGLPITDKQVAALKKAKDEIHFDRILQLEAELKHDVMSHLKAFGELAPEAEGIMHLGATSCFITDNADVILFRQAVELLSSKLILILETLNEQMKKYRDLEMCGFTHFQPAQPVTLGKRMALWAQDILWDLEELKAANAKLVPLGCKGTTGTQASFMVLFKNDKKKVRALDAAVCKRMGFDKPVALSGQTLSRKVDAWYLNALSNLASSFSKMSYDLRLLQHLQEVMEAFGKKQIGSSAMAYKQNPMLAERITGLSRLLMNFSHNASWTHGTQWLERSLDDSSNRRVVLPEAFLTADALCEAVYRLISGLRIDEKKIKTRLDEHAHYFVTEAEMMEGTLRGASRQELHEEIRTAMVKGKLKNKKSPYKLSGNAEQQVLDFSKEVLEPSLKKFKTESKSSSQLATFESLDL